MAERILNGEGIPLDEIFTNAEVNRLKFIKWRDQNIVTDIRKPQEPLPPDMKNARFRFAQKPK